MVLIRVDLLQPISVLFWHFAFTQSLHGQDRRWKNGRLLQITNSQLLTQPWQGVPAWEKSLLLVSPPNNSKWLLVLSAVCMDAEDPISDCWCGSWCDRPFSQLPGGTQKPLLSPGSPPLQRWHWESSKELAELACFEMLSQSPRSALQGSAVGQQQFATQTLRVHLLGIEESPSRNVLQGREMCS